MERKPNSYSFSQCVCVSGRSWSNSYLSIEFLKQNFAARAYMETPALLLWDGFTGRWTSDVVQ
ncbi:hypothetical protein PybrP1_000992 [[Pythium] brassicae (nom. inval.)]|nr:hypothetical protein PybrP1_000992 [[Pythium] brassicae (nom. inval.)]